MPRTNPLPLFLGDLIALVGGLFLALMVRHIAVPSEATFLEHLSVFSSIFVVWFVVFVIAGLYDRSLAFARRRIPGLVLKTQAVNMLLAVCILFVFPASIAPKTVLVLYLVLSTALLAAWRLFVFPLFLTRRSVHALIVGSSDEARALALAFEGAPRFRFVEAQLINPETYIDTAALEADIRTRVDAGVSLIVGDVRSGGEGALTPLFYRMAFEGGEQGAEFVSVRQLYEHVFNRLPPSLIENAWVLEHVSRSPHRLYDIAKRTVDLLGALVLGALSLVAYPFIIAAIKLEDGGPIFYRTERVGQHARPIWIIKFRSMTGRDTGTDALATKHVVTRVGRFLRRTRLDELPQLWNVLRGDLSFIGPRPEMPALADVYAKEIPYYHMRHLIKPGLSGWAQINHLDAPRGGVDLERTLAKLSYDLYYLKQRSLFLDLEIMLKTVRILLVGSGK